MSDKKDDTKLKSTLERIETIVSSDKQAKSSWDCVMLSRQQGRTGTKQFLNLMCDDFMELHGDRLYGDDPAMVGGIGP